MEFDKKIESMAYDLYSTQGERPIGDTFNFGKCSYIVCESDTLDFSGIHYNCACPLCAMNGRCNSDFLYCSGECYWKWRKDGKIIYFKEDKKEG